MDRASPQDSRRTPAWRHHHHGRLERLPRAPTFMRCSGGRAVGSGGGYHIKTSLFLNIKILDDLRIPRYQRIYQRRPRRSQPAVPLSPVPQAAKFVAQALKRDKPMIWSAARETRNLSSLQTLCRLLSRRLSSIARSRIVPVTHENRPTLSSVAD